MGESQRGFHGYIGVGLFTAFPLPLLNTWFVRDVTTTDSKIFDFYG